MREALGPQPARGAACIAPRARSQGAFAPPSTTSATGVAPLCSTIPLDPSQDNVAPCIYGGLQIGYRGGEPAVEKESAVQSKGVKEEHWWTSRVQVPNGLVCVVFVPNHQTETALARGVLSDTIDRKDAIYNISRVALLVNAFSSGNLSWLRTATQDALHQPQRAAAVHKHLKPCIEAALDAGAHGCFLSGAGPSVMAFAGNRRGDILAQSKAERKELQIAEAMLDRSKTIECPGRVYVTRPVDMGAHIVKHKDPAIGSHREGEIKYV